MQFDQTGECEQCKKVRKISRNLICQECLADMERTRRNPLARDRRLKKLNQVEAGVRAAIGRQTALATHQSNPPQKMTPEKLGKAAELGRSLARGARSVEVWGAASDIELSDARETEPFSISLDEVSEELIKYLASKPADFKNLHPRKFEELVCELLLDQGHEAILTPAGNDGGRDVLVTVKSSLGPFFALVECKRWDRAGNVPKSIVERFVFTVREQDKANMGIIVATTGFASGGRKVAASYEHLIKLADSLVLSEMAERYGTWGEVGTSQIWMPDY